MLSISIAAIIIYLTYEATKYHNRKIEELNEREIMEIKNEIAAEKREPLKVTKEVETVKNRASFRNFKMDKLDKDMESVKKFYQNKSVNKTEKVIVSNNSRSIR